MEKRRKDGEVETVLVVIGGMVLDIQATYSIPPHLRTTCPGHVHYLQGGVARNIVECMTNLGAQPFMISSLGFDMPAGIRKHQDVETPIVCHILDVTREVEVGVASVEAVEMFLSPEWILQFKHTIHSALLLMVDANESSYFRSCLP
ncbi:hypothetical protein Gohar_004958, partial [Gossypium harknessii]|nr:hypothetical protein [Gossypium harknessii]